MICRLYCLQNVWSADFIVSAYPIVCSMAWISYSLQTILSAKGGSREGHGPCPPPNPPTGYRIQECLDSRRICLPDGIIRPEELTTPWSGEQGFELLIDYWPTSHQYVPPNPKSWICPCCLQNVGSGGFIASAYFMVCSTIWRCYCLEAVWPVDCMICRLCELNVVW